MGKYKVKCKVCGKHFKCITRDHLKYKHNMTIWEYKKQFPNSKTISLSNKNIRSARFKEIQKEVKNKRKKNKNYDKWFRQKRQDIVAKSLQTIKERRKNPVYNENYIKAKIPNIKKATEKKLEMRKDPNYDKLFREKCRENQKNNIKNIHKIIKMKRNKDSEYNKKYLNQRRKNICKTHKIVEEMRKNPEYDKKYRRRMRKISLLGIKTFRENKPYWFMGVPFDSGITKNSERECAKLFHKYFAWIPEEGMNCHIRIGKYEYDFLLGNNFIEFHPLNTWYDTTIKNYYQKRRENLNKNGHKNNKLFILQSFDDVKDFCILTLKNKKIHSLN